MNYVLAFILGALALACVLASRRPGFRFELHDYQGNEGSRFVDGVKSSLLQMCGAISIIMAISVVGFPESFTSVIPLFLCIGGGMLPISLLGAYTRSFWQKKLFGGYQPYLRKALLNEEVIVPKLTPGDLQVPRQAGVIAGTIAVVAMSATFLGFQYGITWNGESWTHIAFSFGMALLIGFGVFMQIISAITSRQIEKARSKARETETGSGQKAA